jgi:hypothetical protein
MNEVFFLQLAEHDSQQVRTGALDALDRAICGILASPQFQESVHRAIVGKDFNVEGNGGVQHGEGSDVKSDNGDSSVSLSKQQGNDNIALECTLLQPLCSLYNYGRITDVRAGALRILLHVLEVSPSDWSCFCIPLSICMFIGMQICMLYS